MKISSKIIKLTVYYIYTFAFNILVCFVAGFLINMRELIGECVECLRDDILRDLGTICTFGSRSKGHWVHFHSKKHAI